MAYKISKIIARSDSRRAPMRGIQDSAEAHNFGWFFG